MAKRPIQEGDIVHLKGLRVGKVVDDTIALIINGKPVPIPASSEQIDFVVPGPVHERPKKLDER